MRKNLSTFCFDTINKFLTGPDTISKHESYGLTPTPHYPRSNDAKSGASLIRAIIVSISVAFGMANATECMAESLNNTPLSKDCAEQNQIIIKDQLGQSFLSIKWAIGTPENLVRIKIPLKYVYWASLGCKRIDNLINDINRDGPYTTSLFLKAMLPELQPWSSATDEEIREDIYGKMVRITAYSDAITPEKNTIIKKIFEFSKNLSFRRTTFPEYPSLTTIYGFGDKVPRFGLNRVGPIGNFEWFRENMGGPFIFDYYFNFDEMPGIFLKCHPEEIKNYREDRAWGNRVTICDHIFYNARLDMHISMKYNRSYLSQWKQIQDIVDSLFNDISITSN